MIARIARIRALRARTRYRDVGQDETATAARTTAWLGVQHHIVPVGEAELADNLEQAVYHAEHHNQNLNFVGKFLLSRMVHAHGYRVVLTGEGADEQFASYPCSARMRCAARQRPTHTA